MKNDNFVKACQNFKSCVEMYVQILSNVNISGVWLFGTKTFSFFVDNISLFVFKPQLVKEQINQQNVVKTLEFLF